MSDLELLDCSRYPTLRLTKSSCAGRWKKAKTLPDRSLSTIEKCKGCAVGACNAGQKVQSARQTVASDRVCARCGQGAFKLVERSICVSCKNREYELIKGINARGAYPTHARPLRPFFGVMRNAKDINRDVRIERTSGGVEAALRVVRAATDEIFVAFRRPLMIEDARLA